MPPKTRFDREAVVQAAFHIASEEGYDAITARSVAARLGSSVAPIYVNFAAIEDLIRAVVDKVFALSQEYLAREQGPAAFENIGRASLAFARDYPVLVREMAAKPNPWMREYEAQELAMVEMMGEDPELAGWTVDERKRLFVQMRAFQLGLSLMVANQQIPSWFGEANLEALVMLTGTDLILAGNTHKKEQAQ